MANPRRAAAASDRLTPGKIHGKSNPINALTKQQLVEIFSGNATDWSQVGGSGRPIDVYAGDDDSDDLDTFKARVLRTIPLFSKAARYENSAKLSDEVAADPNGIGFAGCKPSVRLA
jgi:phosphate transport system substrate-binding protein